MAAMMQAELFQGNQIYTVVLGFFNMFYSIAKSR